MRGISSENCESVPKRKQQHHQQQRQRRGIKTAAKKNARTLVWEIYIKCIGGYLGCACVGAQNARTRKITRAIFLSVCVCVFVVGRFVDNIRKQIFTTLFSLIFMKDEYFHKATLACSMCVMLSMWDTKKLHGAFGRSRTA